MNCISKCTFQNINHFVQVSMRPGQNGWYFETSRTSRYFTNNQTGITHRSLEWPVIEVRLRQVVSARTIPGVLYDDFDQTNKSYSMTVVDVIIPIRFSNAFKRQLMDIQCIFNASFVCKGVKYRFTYYWLTPMYLYKDTDNYGFISYLKGSWNDNIAITILGLNP